MQFEQVSKADPEILKIFIPNRKNFDFSQKSAIKQLTRIIHKSVAFYKVYHDKGKYAGHFKGCLFVNSINDETKTINFGGFADRHAHTTQAIKELVAYLKYHYPDYKIEADTKFLTAKISLIRAGLQRKKGGFYE